MLRGWFDAFRSNGGPTLYSEANRTAVIEDLRNILVYVSFSTLFVAFLLVFPGIRKERLSTLVCVTTSLFIGAVLLLSNFGTDWHVASSSISTPYRAFSTEVLHADISVRIGLNSVNVTLKASPHIKHSDDINYNEKFTWIGASQMKSEYRDALAKGLPFPILTIAEYLSHDVEGFSWGAKYRKAGYYTCVLLWWAFAIWLLSNILLCMVPRYGAYAMFLTGLSMLASAALYSLMLPKHPPLVIRFEAQQRLVFTYGFSYWAVVTAGVLGTLVGGCASLVDAFYPNKFSTIFEVDYDTPYRYFVGQDNVCPPSPARQQPSGASSRGLHHPPLASPTSKEFLLGSTSSPPGSPSVKTPEVGGLVNAAFDDDDDERGSTIVDGKRAVSLRHFGKFAQREAIKKPHFGSLQKKINSLSGSFPKRSGQVNLNLHSAAMW